MKELLALTLTVLSFGFMGWSETKAGVPVTAAVATKASSGDPQWPNQNRRWRRHNRNSRSRVTTYQTTRIVRYGRRAYRETYLVRYLPNGRTQTSLISRVRIA